MVLESSHDKKTIFLTIMVIDVNWTYCGDHYTIYTNIKTLHCTPDINVMLWQLYLNKKTENWTKIGKATHRR